MVKLHVILAQSEGDPEIDLVAGEVVARKTFSILTTTAVIRPNTIINLFLGRMDPQHADWFNAILPRIYGMNNNISADYCGHTTVVLGGFSRKGHTTFVLGEFF